MVAEIANEVGATTSDKNKWSFKSHFRRKSSSSLLSPPASAPDEEHVAGGRISKDNATFYLALTVAAEGQPPGGLRAPGEGGGAASLPALRNERRRKSSITPSVSSTASSSCEATLTKARPISAPGSSLYRNSSSGSNSGVLFRPTNPPPAPPTGSSSAKYSSWLWSAKPLWFRTDPRGRAGVGPLSAILGERHLKTVSYFMSSSFLTCEGI